MPVYIRPAGLPTYRTSREHAGALTAASVVIYLLPVVAVILGAIVLAEPITWPVLLGITIVLVCPAVDSPIKWVGG